MPQCHYCHQSIAPGVHPYTLKLELFPAVEPSLEITCKDLEVDFDTEMARLIKLMEAMDVGEVIRQEKLVHLSHRFTLCPACRNRLARQLDRLAPPSSLS